MIAFLRSFGLAAVACLALPAGATAASLARGEEVYSRCAACHSLEADRTGPRHCGLLGRRAGSVPGFEYSPAMRRSGLTWNERSLDRFLADPMGVVPGTTMGYAGVKDARERADLIGYLRSAPGCASPAKR